MKTNSQVKIIINLYFFAWILSVILSLTVQFLSLSVKTIWNTFSMCLSCSAESASEAISLALHSVSHALKDILSAPLHVKLRNFHHNLLKNYSVNEEIKKCEKWSVLFSTNLQSSNEIQQKHDLKVRRMGVEISNDQMYNDQYLEICRLPMLTVTRVPVIRFFFIYELIF